MNPEPEPRGASNPAAPSEGPRPFDAGDVLGALAIGLGGAMVLLRRVALGEAPRCCELIGLHYPLVALFRSPGGAPEWNPSGVQGSRRAGGPPRPLRWRYATPGRRVGEMLSLVGLALGVGAVVVGCGGGRDGARRRGPA